jgi:hypothetical protein
MKKVFQFLIACTIVILFSNMTGCGKPGNPCEKINCLNGGACIDGTCSCPTGYEGLRCEKRIVVVDPCAGIKCLNGGTCISGSCNCPPGYSGKNCEIVSECYVYNKGTIKMTNNSKTGKKYALYVDGALIGTPNPSESATVMVSVGNHNIQFKVHSTGAVACTAATIQVTRCNVSSWSCDF